MTGRTLGHYEILEALGAGGMGEVYRARDTKLERDVAIKVLPEKVAGDAELLARFEREARLLASLNHANIAHIYGLEHEGDEQFIVMEVVEGETLEERVERVGRLDLEEAVDIARQIAVGLEAAHEAAVVHRDLKPANVKITAGGDVKILDFGLATNSWVEGEGDTDASNSPTMLAATGAGIIMGTAAYMSPEQAKGQRVDRRTDIWAFGVVLYEMLSGTRLFEAETVSEVLADVLRAPIDLQALPAGTPPRLRRLIERCLDRNPKTRLRDIGEARVLLADEAMLRDGAEASVTFAGQGRTRPSPIAATGMLVVAAILVAATAWITRSTMPAPSQRVARVLDIVVDAAPGPGTALSPDGSKLAYWRRGVDLVVQDLLTGASSTVFSREDPTGGYGRPHWSPDGRELVVDSAGVAVAMAATGGDVRVVAETGRSSGTLLVGWGPGGVLLLGEGGIETVAAGGGSRDVLIPADGAWSYATSPVFLDNGDALFAARRRDAPAALYVRSGDSTTLLRELPFATQFPRVLYGGGAWLLIDVGSRSEPAVWAMPFDARRRVSEGDPVRVLPGARGPTMSREGALLYVDADAFYSELDVVWVSRQGAVLETVRPASELRPLGSPAISPDGQRMAVVVGETTQSENRAAREDDEAPRELLVYEFATPGAPSLLFSGQDIDLVGWLPDSRHVVITRAEDDALAIEALSLDGDRPLSLASARGSRGGRAGFIGRMRPALSTDGGRLTYVDPEGTLQMVNIGPDLGASAPQPAAGDRPLDASNLSVAPTGDLAAVVSGSPTQNALALMPLPAAAPTFPIGNNTRSPRWSADGTELFFHQVASAAASYLMAVTVDPAAGRPTGAPVPLFPMTIAPRQYLSAGFDVAPDGQRFLMVLLRQPPTRHVLIEDFDAFMAARAR